MLHHPATLLSGGLSVIHPPPQAGVPAPDAGEKKF